MMTVDQGTPSRALRRRLLLEAGVTPLLADHPWARIRMADVAATAGVSRQTLYDEFGSRRGLAEAYVQAETERFLEMVDQALEAAGPEPRAALFSAMSTFLRAARKDGILKAITDRDEGGGNHDLLVLVTTQGGGVLDRATERLAAFFATRWPGVDPDGGALAARTLVRLALSYATRPDGSPDEGATEVAAVLGPYLEALVTAGR
jgi:AcrR family transcriptional regulator